MRFLLITLVLFTSTLYAQRRSSVVADSIPTRGLDLKEVVVTAKAPPITYRGDTTEYNAGSFKVKAGGVVEDLLKTLPGLRVDRNGMIKSQGKQVQRVLVDGKPFFGDDATIATKNLPADMIDKVQLIDQKSELAQFTGVDDGQNNKVINLITKKNRKKGVFGNVNAGAGLNELYEAGANINSFSGERQLSVLAKSNNINKSGFSNNELIQMAARDPNALNNLSPLIMNELMGGFGDWADGVTTTHYGGVNFNNDWGRRLSWHSSYFYNSANTRNDYARERQHFLADTSWIDEQRGHSLQRNHEHHIETTAEFRFNERTSLKLSPRFSKAVSDASEQRAFSATTFNKQQLLNEGRQSTRSHNDTRRFDADLLFRHKFRRKGHSLMVTLSPEVYESDYTYLNQSQARYLNVRQADSTNQLTRSAANNSNIDGKAVYTFPVNRRIHLQLSERLRYSAANTNRHVSNFDVLKQQYTDTDIRYSDHYTYQTLEHHPDLLLSLKDRKLSLSAGLAYKKQTIGALSYSKQYEINKVYGALLPHLFLKYQHTKWRKTEFEFRRDSYMPGIGQLQPLEDNSSAMITRRGNTALRQSVEHHTSLFFENNSKDQKRSQHLRLRYSAKPQAVTDQSILDTLTGRQLIYPINVKGNYDAALESGVSFSTGKNGTHIDINAGTSYGHSIGYVTGRRYYSDEWSTQIATSSDVNLGEYFSLHAKGEAAYHDRRFGTAKQLSWTFSYELSPALKLSRGLSVEASLLSRLNTGLSNGYNTNVRLLHGRLHQTIGKAFSLELSGRDLLNQHKNIRRTAGNGYVEDVRGSVPGRYFLLSVAYKLSVFPTK
ncbi:outer membrane beta-barrel protein [Chitinophaga horti]|uniref:Outer membrane beta-barrel protein n=1 Tax=Chitinophaga horti TaxID=2920382 RepID=A0ABY6JB82_9BACT|nr:outer membrane beta-barrel protein [Chitinophaga horti]UYQ95439.1 outer membrane beta-barrel protein [Chitinophaga horti]